MKLSRDLQSGLANDADPQQTIPLIISFVCDSLLAHPETVRLLYVAGFELAGADRVLREHLGPIFDAISAYFSRCAAKGIIADFDPTIATLGVAGAVGAHHALRSIFTEHATAGDIRTTLLSTRNSCSRRWQKGILSARSCVGKTQGCLSLRFLEGRTLDGFLSHLY